MRHCRAGDWDHEEEREGGLISSDKVAGAVTAS
jgi:hypothetical protein